MNLANQVGEYTGFTGKIRTRDTSCEVKNATFEILTKPKHFKNKFEICLIFHSGEVVDGEMGYAKVSDCLFKGSLMRSCVFLGGTFDGGGFYYSMWYGGEWESGDWWLSYDKFGRVRSDAPTTWNSSTVSIKSGIADSEGKYSGFSGRIIWGESDFKIKDADFELSANRQIIFIHGGIIESGVIKDARVSYCVSRGGDWYSCVFEDGVFEAGNWRNGTWLGGDWLDGVWYGGFDKDMNLRTAYDSPDKWDK